MDINKSEFHQTKIKYLGMIITTGGLEIDPDKVRTVAQQSIPRNQHDIQSFLSFANFYRRFIKNFKRIALLIIKLTRTTAKNNFRWTPQYQ